MPPRLTKSMGNASGSVFRSSTRIARRSPAGRVAGSTAKYSQSPFASVRVRFEPTGSAARRSWQNAPVAFGGQTHATAEDASAKMASGDVAGRFAERDGRLARVSIPSDSERFASRSFVSSRTRVRDDLAAHVPFPRQSNGHLGAFGSGNPARISNLSALAATCGRLSTPTKYPSPSSTSLASGGATTAT